MTAFLDTNVVISIINEDEPQHAWAVAQLDSAQRDGAAYVCDIVYCELTMGLGTKLDADRVIEQLSLQRIPNRDDALVRAGQAYMDYKQANKGQFKAGVLPDFFVGSIAEMADTPLVTNNAKDFVKYFPDLQVIQP